MKEIPWTGSTKRPPLYLLHLGLSSPVEMLTALPRVSEKIRSLFSKKTAEFDLLYRGNVASDGLISTLEKKEVDSSSNPEIKEQSVSCGGWDAIHEHFYPVDEHGYGTRVAHRVITESKKKGQLIQVMDCKWLNDRREGFYSDALSALYFALDHGAQKYICHWNFPVDHERYALNRLFDEIRARGGEIFSDPSQKIFGEKKTEQASSTAASGNAGGIPLEEPAPKQGVIESHECTAPQPGYKGSVTTIRTNLKYPLIRREEIRNDQGKVVGQNEMVADHFLMKLPAGETQKTFLQKLGIPTTRLSKVPWSDEALHLLHFNAEELGIPHAVALSTIAEIVSERFPKAAPEMDLLYRGRVQLDEGYTKYWTTPQAERGDAGMPALSKDPMTLSVLGTGINPNFKGIRAWRGSQQSDAYGWNAIENNFFPKDEHGHGTHEAAIIANDTQSIADRVQILACKWLNERREGFYSNAISSIHFAVDHGAFVLNCSWVFPDMNERRFLLEAFQYAGMVDPKKNKKSAMVVLDTSAVGKSETRELQTESEKQAAAAEPAKDASRKSVSELASKPDTEPLQRDILTTGLQNGGNDCFMNASLQLVKGLELKAPIDMLALEEFLSAGLPLEDSYILRCELAHDVMAGSQEFDAGPHDTVSNIRSSKSSFVQKDAGAFLSLLLRRMDMISVCFSEELTHPQTGEVRRVTDGVQHTILPLALPPAEGFLALQEIFDRNLNSQIQGYCWIDKDESSRVDLATKKQLSEPIPSALVVSMGRYGFQGSGGIKRKDLIGGLLDNIALTKENGENVFYHVNAIVCHLGKTLNEGHYICFRKEGDKWFYFNDDEVREIKMTGEVYRLISENCYLISLKRLSLPGEGKPAK